MVNVGKYTMYGSYGKGCQRVKFVSNRNAPRTSAQLPTRYGDLELGQDQDLQMWAPKNSQK